MTPQQISELFDKNAMLVHTSKETLDKDTFLRLVEEIEKDAIVAFSDWYNHEYHYKDMIVLENIQDYLIETKNK